MVSVDIFLQDLEYTLNTFFFLLHVTGIEFG